MQSENFPEFSPQTIGDPIHKTRSNRNNLMIWIHAITFLLGLALLVYVIYVIGFRSIVESVTRVGWGFLPIIALNVIRHLMRAWSMYLAIPVVHRTFKYRVAVAARFGGEAISFLTFTGPFLGDATKAVLLKKDLPLAHGAAAVIIDNILYYVSVIVMVLGGIGALQYLYGTNGNTMDNVFIGIFASAILMIACLFFAIKFRLSPISWIIKTLARCGLVPKFVSDKASSIHGVETTVIHFYHNRRRDFFILFGISLMVHVVSVTEVYLVLILLGFDSYWSNAFIIEGLTKVINVVFGFVPGTIGVYEGGNGIILHWLGYAAAVGVALALVRRGAILFSTFVGLVILLWRTVARGTQHLAKSRA